MPLLDAALRYLSNNPQQAVGLLTGLSATLAHYRKTGKLPIGRLPWRSLRQILRDLRHRYYTKPRPKGVPGLVVDAPPAAIEEFLRRHHFEFPPTSYNYRGEDLNLRRPSGTAPNPNTGHPVAMELHVRGFATTDDRTLLIAHEEASRYEAQSLHLDGGLTSFADGREHIKRLLNQTELTVENIESERSAEIDVA